VTGVQTCALPICNTDTRWSSAFAASQWFQVDLGAPATLGRVAIDWEAAYAKAYQVQASDDGATWTTLHTVTAGDGGSDEITGLTGSGRYVRLYGTKRGTGYGYSVWELKVYGVTCGSAGR